MGRNCRHGGFTLIEMVVVLVVISLVAVLIPLHLVPFLFPGASLSVLSTLNLDSVQRAVFSDEPDLLSRVPGVGKKTAQKMALHLKDKLKPMDTLATVAAMTDRDSEVLAALTALGYSVVEVQSAIQSLPKDAPEDTEERLRMALQYFQ